jgi:multisubunit Na+/H+ antiporter MnhB subunit
MVYGGFTYLTAQGDPSKAKRGRDVILYGLVGLAVTLLAFAIVAFVTANLPSPS